MWGGDEVEMRVGNLQSWDGLASRAEQERVREKRGKEERECKGLEKRTFWGEGRGGDGGVDRE